MNNAIKYPLVLGAVCVAAGVALAFTFSSTIGQIEAKNEQKRSAAVVTAFFDAQPETNTWNNIREFDVETRKEVAQRRKGQQTYLVAYKDKARTQILGYAAEGRQQGYSSKVAALVGAEALAGQPGRYRILGVRIINQNETPGLGAQCNQVFSDATVWSWAAEFFNGEEGSDGPELTDEQKKVLGEDAVLRARPAFENQFTGKIVKVTGTVVEGLTLQKGGWDTVKSGESQDDIAAITGATITSNAAVGAVRRAVVSIHNIVTGTTATE